MPLKSKHFARFTLTRHICVAALLACAQAAALAANIAAPGSAILGTKASVDDTLGTLRFNSGAATNIIDSNLGTRVDNWSGGAEGRPVSFVGVIWETTKYDAISNLVLTLATFGDGGWFGVPGALPPAGGALAATNLIEPTIQVTTNWGTNWITVASSSDYQTVMLGHQVGGTGGQPNPSSKAATFTLPTPATRINGIRIIGSNGGLAGADTNGFLGIFDLAVNAEAFVDGDTDGMADAWKSEYAVNDPADDPDFDNLSNLQEFTAGTNPNNFDTDNDTLPDGDEVLTYFTSPLWADTDADNLADGLEINTYLTNPKATDSDGDGLSDGAEVYTYFSNPLLFDTDGDLFPDRMEVLFGGNPASPQVFPDNIALIGTNIIGVKQSWDTGADTPYAQQAIGSRVSINDGNLNTRVDTYNGATTTTLSYVGIVWPFMVTNPIAVVDLTMATYLDGGWFGVNNVGPSAGGGLTAAHLTEPTLQISTDGGISWTSVPFTSDYTNKLTGHRIGGGTQPNPTSITVSFTLAAPTSNINGIRLIGTDGGTASRGFLGVGEFTARKLVSDSDRDGISDSWELIHGLTVGTNDAAGDLDADGLTNIQEFNRDTDPQSADTDADGLNDGPEVNAHGTNPLRADTDADGLTDGAEVTTHQTDPLKSDTDSDGFPDGLEVADGSNPKNASSFPSNLALMSSATGIIGVKAALDSAPGIPHANAGGAPNVNDGNLTTRVDTWNVSGGERFSYVGILWTNLVTNPIVRLELTFATFYDGGWFGVNASDPGAGGALTPAYLREPTVQVSTDGGASWTTVRHASDYLTRLNGHLIGGGSQPNPTTVKSHFLFIDPVVNINGIRIIGSEGGTASGGFLGVMELAARNMPADTDNDGMNDEWEGFYGLVVGTDDSSGDADSDGLSNKLEFVNNTKPTTADTDGDGLSDGAEVNTHHSNPTSTDTDGDGLSDDAEVNTHQTDPSRADSDSDGFRDGLELAKGTNPKDNASHPANYALAGRGILGIAPSVGSSLGTLVFNAGIAANITDENTNSRIDSFSFAADTNSFVGILWDSPMTNINALELKLATFFDGGWFGVNGTGPGSGNVLSSSQHLLVPALQISRDGGLTWSTVPSSSDYMTALNGHPLPAVDFGPPTLATAHFYTTVPQTNINGIRIIGSEGGPGGAGFLGVFELGVSYAPAIPVTLMHAELADGNKIRFEFDSMANVTHAIQFKNNWGDPEWQLLININGDGTRKSVTDTLGSGMRVYRVISQ